ncbi:MAG: hypothetical protein QM796_16160 [Chthoniobacteraceae bacterium]
MTPLHPGSLLRRGFAPFVSALTVFSPFAFSHAASTDFSTWARTPPLGWNSYDVYGDSVVESEVLANAAYMQKHLLAHGWNTVVVDFRWYDPKPTRDDRLLNKTRVGAELAADQFGRLLPAPNRFPSAVHANGFQPLADRLHAMGLKFGIHIMRGIPRQAVLAKSLIEGSKLTAAEAGNPEDKCPWCPDMFGVRANAAGQAWVRFHLSPLCLMGARFRQGG